MFRSVTIYVQNIYDHCIHNLFCQGYLGALHWYPLYRDLFLKNTSFRTKKSSIPCISVRYIEMSAIQLQLDSLVCEYVKLTFSLQIITQWNLSIANMLYSGHLSIADTLSRNQLTQATVKLLYFEPLYSGLNYGRKVAYGSAKSE